MSEPWAINAGKASTAIGTATIEADDELFTITDHGLGVGDTVVVDTLTGGASGVLDEGQVYWVVDVTTNTFALSQHRNGAPVEFSSDGGADVYRFAPQYTALELRRLHSGLLTKEGDRFGAREGIHPACDPAISVSGTTWTVENVCGTVYPALTSTSGPYDFAHPEESGSLDPADGSNNRIDALDLQIQDDDEDASGRLRARVVYVTGTPGSGSPPSQTSNSLRLGTILVPAGGSPSPSVSDDVEPPLTVAAGGTTPVRSDSEGPADPHHGQLRYRRDTDELEADDGTAWLPIARSGGWVSIASGEGFSGSSITPDLTAGGRFPAGTFERIKLVAYGDLTGVAGLRLRINSEASTIYRYGLIIWDSTDGSVDSVASSSGASGFTVGQWGGGSACSLEVDLYSTHQNTATAFTSSGTQITAPPLLFRAGGSLNAGSLLPSSLFLAGLGEDFAELNWWVEGYRS